MIKDILNKAKTLGACHLADLAIQSWSELAQLYFSPQGLEFCSLRNFPSLRQWRKIKAQHDLGEFGIFVDGQVRHCVNRPHVAVIGTDARLEYDHIGKYTIVLQHGARAIIKASNYAVLHIVKIGECDVRLESDKTVRLL